MHCQGSKILKPPSQNSHTSHLSFCFWEALYFYHPKRTLPFHSWCLTLKKKKVTKSLQHSPVHHLSQHYRSTSLCKEQNPSDRHENHIKHTLISSFKSKSPKCNSTAACPALLSCSTPTHPSQPGTPGSTTWLRTAHPRRMVSPHCHCLHTAGSRPVCNPPHVPTPARFPKGRYRPPRTFRGIF